MTNSASLLSILRLASPALPVGAFAYSQGLEYAVEAGWVTDRKQTQDWIEGVLEHGIGRLDIPVLLRLHRAAFDADAFEYWNNYCLASRESRELRLEEQQLGRTLSQLLKNMEQPLPEIQGEPGWLAMFAYAARQWQINEHDACLAYAWSWLENQLAAAAKTVPIGQTDGQKIIGQLTPVVLRVVDQGKQIQDRDIGGSLPGFAMASSLHERQYSRLFRS